MCARCRLRPRLSQMTGCLCEECEDEISGMTQSELDADYEAHTRAAEASYRALPREGFPRPGEPGYPPPPPRPSRGAATTASGSVPVFLSEAMFVPSGHDPYGPHFRNEDCVLSVRTGRCVRDHDCPRESS